LYNFLKNKPFISGIDLDIEEEVDINNVKKLINKIINDFGEDYIITTAPVLSSLISDTPGMGGFCYKTLLNSKEGSYIKYINCQAYYNYTLSSLQKIVENGYNVNQIVMGMIAGESYSDELLKMVQTYGSQLGGIFVWEYFNTQPSPQEWLIQVGNILNKTTVSKFCTIS
jgi:alkaline phosphatase D